MKIFYYPKTPKNIFKKTQFSISYRCPQIWNTVLKNQQILQNSKNPSIFKHNLKQLIMSTNNNNDAFKSF